MAFGESTPSEQSPRKIDRRTYRAFLAIGVIGILGAIVLNIVWQSYYMEYIRLYNSGADWSELMPLTNLFSLFSVLHVYPPILYVVGLYGVICWNRGRFGLIYVLITLWPHSFNSYEAFGNLFVFFGFYVDIPMLYLLNYALIISVAVFGGIVLATTKRDIRRPKLLYLVIGFIVLQPIVSMIAGFPHLATIAPSVIEYLLWYGPGTSMYYAKLVLIAALFIMEFKDYSKVQA